MNCNNVYKAGLGLALIMGLTLATPAANAQLEASADALNVNLVGILVGTAPDYMGSADYKAVAGPIIRYQFEGSQRYFQWLGPKMTLNLIDDSAWRAGPMLNFRGKRDSSDVNNDVVGQMQTIDATVEAGVFLQYNLKLSEQKMHQLVFSGDVAGSDNGTVGNLRVVYYQPLTESITGLIGVGMTYANDEWVQTYYGVSGSDIRLFPSLGGQAYNPSGGAIGVNIPFGAIWTLNKEWMVLGLGRYEKLQGDAKDSPIVSQEGDSNQWVFAVGIAYRF